MVKVAVFFLIDALRYDALADEAVSRRLTPHIRRFFGDRAPLRCISNGQATQFALPALFSQTYPLDHGGYNTGIRDRPASFVECIRRKGFHTVAVSALNLFIWPQGYDRGFDEIFCGADYVRVITGFIERVFLHQARLYRAGSINREQCVSELQREFGVLLAKITENYTAAKRSGIWSRKMARENEWVRARIDDERHLLETDPEAIIDKMLTVAPDFYAFTLGERRAKWTMYLRRAIEGALWRSRVWANRFKLPVLFLSQNMTLADSLVDAAKKVAETAVAEKRDTFMYFHALDIHDARNIRDLRFNLLRLRYLPRWLSLKLKGHEMRTLLYDTTLAYVDDQIGRLFAALERPDVELTCVLTGDHGDQHARSHHPVPPIGERTWREQIEVPLIYRGDLRSAREDGLHCSMDITATFLEMLNVPEDASFLGKSVFSNSRRFVITESAGSGSVDMDRKDMYFQVTKKDFNALFCLQADKLRLIRCFDLKNDPGEAQNLAGSSHCKHKVDECVADLIAERGDIIRRRGDIVAAIQ